MAPADRQSDPGPEVTPDNFVPAMPPRLTERLSPIKAILRARQSVIAVWPEEAYFAGFLAQKFMLRWLFIANSPRTVRHVLFSNVENYPKSDEMKNALGPLIGNSMLLSDGAIWRRQRRNATPAFHVSRIKQFSETMATTAAEQVGRWDTAIDQGDGTVELEMGEQMAKVTAEVICRTMFSSDLGDKAAIIYESFTKYIDALRQVEFDEFMGLPSWLPKLPSFKAKRALRSINRVLDEMIHARRGHEDEYQDLLSILLAVRDEDTGGDRPHDEIRDELSVFFFAGHETTANALAWTWYLLSQAPNAEAKFHAEIDRVLEGRRPTYADVAKLPYVRSVFEEAMRLYPPIPIITRKSLAEDKIGGKTIPPGSFVAVCPWLLHRHRGLWRNPDHFDPDRFYHEKVEPPPGVEPPKPRHKLAYVPFGAGPRTCIGASFAITEAVLILSSLGQRFRLRLREGHPVEPQSRLTLRPRYGLPMSISRR